MMPFCGNCEDPISEILKYEAGQNHLENLCSRLLFSYLILFILRISSNLDC
jgi:hypothetical protein